MSRFLLGLACLGIAASVVGGAGSARADEEAAGDGEPSWIPSIGPGVGVYSRNFEANVRGDQDVDRDLRDIFGITVPAVRDGLRGPTLGDPPGGPTAAGFVCTTGNPRDFFSDQDPDDPNRDPVPAGICGPFNGSDDDSIDGAAPSVHFQLLGPGWQRGPVKVRPLFQGGVGFPLDSRVVAAAGFKPVDFTRIGQEPPVRIQLEVDPQLFWWVGAGAAFRLPIDRYATRLKVSVGYMQDSLDLEGLVANDFGAGTQSSTRTDELIIHSISPSLGLEADLSRFGPVALTLSGDVYLSVALNDPSSDLTVPAPPAGSNNGTALMSYEGDPLHIFGGVQLRLSWVGWER